MKSERELIEDYIREHGVTKCPDGAAWGVSPTRAQLVILEFIAVNSTSHSSVPVSNSNKNVRSVMASRSYFVNKKFGVMADAHRGH
jgi:hypothetical protein